MTLGSKSLNEIRVGVAEFLKDKRKKRLGVAVSGGGDSMALLHVLSGLRVELDMQVFAVTVDHGLRAEADAEAQMVAGYCQENGVSHQILRWQWDGKGNLQSNARSARYGLTSTWAREQELEGVALGHTKDDVAETFLMRLSRSAGVDGLATMADHFEREGMTWLRPLLGFRRKALRSILMENEITWAEDATNHDTKFQRVRARNALSELNSIGIDVEALSSVANNMRIAKSALQKRAYDIAIQCVSVQAGDVVLPQDRDVDGSPICDETLTRLRAGALQFVSGNPYPPRADALEKMAANVAGGNAQTLHGCRIYQFNDKSNDQIMWRVSREFKAVKDTTSGTEEIWDGRWKLSGPDNAGLEIRALGDAVKDTEWRETGVPRETLRASPAIWNENDLVAAPIAGYAPEWSAKLLPPRDDFAAWLVRR